MLAAKLKGCGHATVVDLAAAPLAFAERLGADRTVRADGDASQEAAFDVAFEATGSAAGLAAAIAGVRRGGTLVQIGNLPAGPLPVPANAVMAKELDLKGSFRFGAEFNEAVDLIASGAVDVLSLVTAERALSSAPEAFRLALDRSQSVKVMLSRD
jgi:L-idonate 5-dehydrogenase